MSMSIDKPAHNFVDMTGQRFGRLTVLSRAESKGNMSRWRCLCDCGNETVVYANNLRRGYTRSCGCYRHECEEERASERTTHHESTGVHKTRLYGIWTGMKTRCCNPNAKSYERYGARGIGICSEWMESYIAFRNWSIANGYRDDLSIDRIDNDGGYSPENCRWTTAKEQANNRIKRRWKKRPEGVAL